MLGRDRSGSTVLELLLSDGRTPTGAYAHSGGLEPAILAGAQIGDVPAIMLGRLHAIALPEAAMVCAARRWAGDPEMLKLLDAESAARTPSPALRRTSAQLGRALLRTAATLWPQADELARYAALSEHTPRPVAFGVVAATAGLTATGAARVWLYDDAAAVASAAPKLLPVPATVATGWVASLAAEIEDLAQRAARAGSRSPAELPASCAPLLDERSLGHEHEEGRLFAS